MLFPRLGMNTLKWASTCWWMFCSSGVIRLLFLSVVLVLSVLGGSALGSCTFGASRGMDGGGGVAKGCSCACWSAGGGTGGLAAGGGSGAGGGGSGTRRGTG